MARSASILAGRKRAPPQASARSMPLPAHVAPMLAVASDRLPLNPSAYSFEWKWDGVRAICFIERGRMRLESRNLLEITARYPELQAMKSTLGRRSAILDGEVVAL